MADSQDIITIKFKPENEESLIKAINSLDKATKSLINTQVSLAKSSKNQSKQHTSSQKTMTALNVKLKALGHSFKKAGIDTKLLTEAYKGKRVAIVKVKNQVAQYERKLKGLSIQSKKAEQRTRILGGTLAVLRSKLLLVNFLMALFINKLRQMATAGATAESLGMAFDTLSGKVEKSSVALEKLKIATNNTMSEFDLFKQANNAMVLGVANNSDTMAEMFDVAQRLGRALGRDTASSVESLVTGIGRQSRLMLDNIGIIVKSEEAYEDYAKKIGKTAEALTDVEKKQAFLEATMESARKKVSTLGDEIKSSRDVIDEMTASANDLSTTFGQFLEPVTNDLAKSFTKLFNAGTRLLKGEKEQVDNTKEINQLIAQRNILLGYTTIGTKKTTDISKLFTGALLEESSVTKEILGASVKEIDSRLKQLGLMEEVAIASGEIRKAKEEELAVIEKVNVDNIASEQYWLDQRTEIYKKYFEENSNLYQAFFEGYDQFVDDMLDKDKTAQEVREGLMDSFSKGMIKLFSELLKESIKNFVLQTVVAKAGQKTAEIGAKTTGASIAKSYATPAALASSASFGASAVAGASALAGTVALATALSKFEGGGLIGGKRHSQGGTIIEAERGEFVMSRKSVESIGVETLNAMNQGKSNAGVTINVNGNMIGNESFVRDILLPEINKTIRGELA